MVRKKDHADAVSRGVHAGANGAAKANGRAGANGAAGANGRPGANGRTAQGRWIDADAATKDRKLFSKEREKTFRAQIKAIDGDQVDLYHIVVANHISGCATTPDPRPGDEHPSSDIDKLNSAYASKWVEEDRLLCSYIPAAVVLKKKRRQKWQFWRRSYLEIEIEYLPEATRTTSSAIEKAIRRAKSLALDARDLTSRRRRNSRIRDIFSLFVDLLSRADAEAMFDHRSEHACQAPPKLDDELEDELSDVQAEVRRSLSIEARHRYLDGMLIGAVILGGGVWTIEKVVPLLGRAHLDTLGLGTIIAGGIGAVLSVMTRLTANNLKVDPGAGRWLVVIAGGFRPLIGGIFAFAVYVFVQGGLLPVKVTTIGLKETYFFLGVAFLAGFSERFAQDAVTRAGSVIADTGPPSASGSPAQ